MSAGLLTKLGLQKEDKKKQAEKPAKEKVAAKKKVKEKEPKVKSEKKAVKTAVKTKDSSFKADKKGLAKAHKVLLKVMDTEKTSRENALGKYYFLVDKQANKRMIAEAVGNYYGVTVKKVNVVNIKPSQTRFGLTQGTHRGWKKAVVTLKEGESISV